MLDIQFIRDNQEKVKKGCRNKNISETIVDELLKVDKRRRTLIKEIDELRAKKNKLSLNSKQVQEKIKEAKGIKEKIKTFESKLKQVKQKYENLLNQIPNLPADDVPEGKDESENQVVKKWGKIPNFSFAFKDHFVLGKSLDLIDVKRASRLSGSRFGYLKKEAVLLEFALIQYGLEILAKENFIPIIPPMLTKVSVFKKLGYCEHGGNEDYYLVYDPKKENPQEEANYYLIGTAEHSLVPMHQNEIFNEKDLPRRYVGFSSAFRREAGSYGKDTRGIFRVHQFDKLEMVSFIKPQPESDKKEHEYLVSLEEKIVQGLKLPHRLIKMCTGDLGHPVARKYDLECWFPSEKKYRETHSCSSCTDYQSRALEIKYRGKNNKTDFVHILNGTAIAIGRTICAILENYQQKDGSVKVPQVLQKYISKKIIKR